MVVVGGGPSGIAAACTSAMLGNKTILIEKNGFLGGAAVAGLSGTICGMYTASAKNLPEQLVYGFCDAFVQEMKKQNGVTSPQKYGHTLVLTHDPLTYKRVSEAMILASGGEILYHAAMIAASFQQGKIDSLLVNTKNGCLKLRAKQFIDASGDGDLAFRSGFSYTVGDNGKIQNPTMIFRMGNVDIERMLDYWGDNTISPPFVTEAILKERAKGENLPREKVWIFPMTNGHEVLMNTTRVIGADGRELNVLNIDDYSEAEMEGRQQVAAYAKFFTTHIPGFENAYTIDTGSEVGVRQTRTINCMSQLKDEDVVQSKKTDSGIARSAWPIEMHTGAKPKVHWIMDDYYTVPIGSLIPRGSQNLVICGRCLCAEHAAMASARVTAQCFEYGKAAALIAHQAIISNDPVVKTEPQVIIDEMRKSNSQI